MITGAKSNAQYLSYLYDKLRGKFSFETGDCEFLEQGIFETLSFNVDEKISPLLRRCAEENIAEVIAIGYKYDYFNKRLTLPLLSRKQKKFTLHVARCR